MNAFLLLASSAISNISACPQVIVDSQRILENNPGWDSRIDNRPRRLDDVEVFSGKPSKRFILPSEPNRNGGIFWKISGDDIWVECRYLDSAATLTKHLGSGVVSCEFIPTPPLTIKPAQMICKRK